MKIDERLQLVRDMVEENPDALAIMVPVHSIQELLAYCEDRQWIQKKYHQERVKVKRYQESVIAAQADAYKKPWTWIEDELIAEGKRQNLTEAAIAAMLNGRTRKAVNHRWYVLKKKKRERIADGN